MAGQRLDRKLLDKVAQKLNKQRKAINDKVYKKATRLGISSEAALVLLARELNIGTLNYQRKLDPAKQIQVRDVLPTIFGQKYNVSRKNHTSTTRGKTMLSTRSVLRSAIEYLVEDKELQSRCKDILLAKDKFDRAINQATQVLEDKIRKKIDPGNQLRLVGESLVDYAFNADLLRTRLKISKNPDEQRGFTFIIRGIVSAFRNKTHHHLTNFTRQEALRVCAFVDVLLRVVDKSVKV